MVRTIIYLGWFCASLFAFLMTVGYMVIASWF